MAWPASTSQSSGNLWGGSSSSFSAGTPVQQQLQQQGQLGYQPQLSQQQQPQQHQSQSISNLGYGGGFSGTPQQQKPHQQSSFYGGASSSNSFIHQPLTQNMYSTASFSSLQGQNTASQPALSQQNAYGGQLPNYASVGGYASPQQSVQQQQQQQLQLQQPQQSLYQGQQVHNGQQTPNNASHNGFYQPNMNGFLHNNSNPTASPGAGQSTTDRVPPRFMSSFFSNSAQSPSRQYDSRSSPEQTHRDLVGSSSGSRALRGSAASGGRDSPSRSPRTTPYNSRISFASTSRVRQNSGASSAGDADNSSGMDEDAPPTTSLDEYDDSTADSAYNQTSGSGVSSSSNMTNGVMSPPHSSLPGSGRRPADGASMTNGASSTPLSSLTGGYKVVVFGYPPNLQKDIHRQFSAIGAVHHESTGSKASTAASESGSNWFTLAYESPVAAQKAVARSGDIVSDAMIGVKYADAASASAAEGSALESTSTSSASTALGTPARVLPASAAFLKPKPTAARLQLARTETSQRIADLGKIDPKVFQQPQANGQDTQSTKKESGGVISTVTNLIFGF